MAIKLPAIGADGAFFGAGLDAAKRVFHGRTYNVCSPEFAGGADPTGVKDCTPAIQAAVDKAAADGGAALAMAH